MTSILQLDAVSCAFPDGGTTRTVLDQIDLRVDAGEMVAVMGPSGSGKSTLVNLACGLVAPSSGTVSISGAQPPLWSQAWWAGQRRRHIGVVHQRHSLIDGFTASENVALPLELDGTPSGLARELAAAALHAVGVADLADRDVESLSVGQQQLITVARGIVGDRPLLLTDEPTAALDSNTAEHVVRLLATLAHQGRAVLLVTHDSRLASWADRIVTLRDGHIVDRVHASSPVTPAVNTTPGTSR